MKKRILLISTILLVSLEGILAQAPAVVPIDWPVLAQVRYKSFQTPGMVEGEKPEPGMAVQRLNGEEVRIRGYVIPLDVEGTNFLLSAQPNESCFFCGKAGIETVAELWLADGHRHFKMDEIVTFRGTLLLNYESDGLLYLLKDAKEVRD